VTWIDGSFGSETKSSVVTPATQYQFGCVFENRIVSVHAQVRKHQCAFERAEWRANTNSSVRACPVVPAIIMTLGKYGLDIESVLLRNHDEPNSR